MLVLPTLATTGVGSAVEPHARDFGRGQGANALMHWGHHRPPRTGHVLAPWLFTSMHDGCCMPFPPLVTEYASSAPATSDSVCVCVTSDSVQAPRRTVFESKGG